MLLQDMVVKAGQKINYTIPIEASPRPKVKWSVNGKPVEPGVRADIQTFGNQTVFEILFSVRNDTGRYTLTLENELGQCSASANVTVLGKCSLLQPLALTLSSVRVKQFNSTEQNVMTVCTLIFRCNYISFHENSLKY
jgi:hypothetical protein